MKETTDDSPILLYDGVCGFCNKTVQMVIDHDKRGTMRFAALQSEFGQEVIKRHPSLKGVDSVIFVERSSATSEERVFIRSRAALRVAAYLGGFWKLFLAAYIVPAPVRDFLYDLFARYRYKVFGKYDSCMLPPQSVRARFLDVE